MQDKQKQPNALYWIISIFFILSNLAVPLWAYHRLDPENYIGIAVGVVLLPPFRDIFKSARMKLLYSSMLIVLAISYVIVSFL